MREIVILILGAVIGFGASFAYSFNERIATQIEVAGVQGKVDAALTLCPAAFVNVVKTPEKK